MFANIVRSSSPRLGYVREHASRRQPAFHDGPGFLAAVEVSEPPRERTPLDARGACVTSASMIVAARMFCKASAARRLATRAAIPRAIPPAPATRSRRFSSATRRKPRIRVYRSARRGRAVPRLRLGSLRPSNEYTSEHACAIRSRSGIMLMPLLKEPLEQIRIAEPANGIIFLHRGG